MDSFKSFKILGYSYDPSISTAYFEYGFDEDVRFREKLELPSNSEISIESVESVLFHIGLAIGIGYYKLYPTTEIEVHTGKLDEGQIEFWRRFYVQGLGEYFFTNDIDPEGLCNFVNYSDEEIPPISLGNIEGCLVPIGGGKDSNVTIALLEKAGWRDQITLYTNGKDYPIHQAVTAVCDLPRVITKREMSPLMFEMNQQGYYNGHVPITGIISFISLLVALLTDNKYIILSNEWSANFGNTEWKGVSINHQWSKSYDFEKGFNDYVGKYISSGMNYFSLLRPWHELRIAQEMSELKQYFPVFSSCNKNFRYNVEAESRRCGDCPKCHFTYMIMRPFLSPEEVQEIRSTEYYQDISLLPAFKHLWGIEGIKPFECVGTHDESQAATWLVSQQDDLGNMPIVRRFTDNIANTKTPSERENLVAKLLDTEPAGMGNIPDGFREMVR